MKKRNAASIIEELRQLTIANRNAAQSFKALPAETLRYKPDAESWSILECIEHLNRYGNFYIPEIAQRIETSKFSKSAHFKAGFFGNYFAKSMLPREKLNKMRAFKSMNPNHAELDSSVLDLFLGQQEQLLQLLEKAADTDLIRVKTATSIAGWIKLRLGDTLRVVVYHNARHIAQAEKVRERAHFTSPN